MSKSAARARPLGRYEVGEELGRGGMGVIHRAYDHLGQREVAYKRMLVPTGRSRAQLTKLFQREYDTLARLPHPNVVAVYDYGLTAEGPYYVMEHLPGDLTLRAPLSVPEVCHVMRDVASALALLHARRLIHRDVSPANVRLAGDQRAKLIDFGGLTAFGVPREIVGTAACIAPECLTDAPLDQRCDLYSLGATAYWLLTRHATVAATRLDELVGAWATRPVAPSGYVPNVPPELDELLLSLLAPDPLARPESAAYVMERLTALAELGPEPDLRRVAYSYLARPPLVGRDDVSAQLAEVLAALERGSGASALIEGAFGLGRTALLDALALKGQIAGAAVVRARGDESAAPFAMARALLDVAVSLYPDLDASIGTRTSGRDTRDQAPSAVDVAARQVAVVESVQTALREVSRRSPLLVLIDDIHLCDGASLSLLSALVEETEHSRICVVLTTRSDLRPRGDPAAYRSLAGISRRLTLAPLGEEQLDALVQSLFGSGPSARRLSVWLFRESGGNPATAMDLARLLVSRGSLRYALGTFVLPHEPDAGLERADLSRALLARIGDLAPPGEELAQLLSLHDGALPVDVLARASGHAAHELVPALEELVRRGIATSDGDGYALTGSTLRGVVVSAIAEAHRRALHGRLAEAFLAGALLALEPRVHASTHLLRADRADEAAAVLAALAPATLLADDAMRWAVQLEEVLTAYRRKASSDERLLSLILPIAHGSFYQNLPAQMRLVEEALALLSRVTGLLLARRLGPFVGGHLALLVGLTFGALKRRLTPPAERLGSLRAMISHYVAIACAGTASAASIFDPVAAQRFNGWLAPFAVLPRRSSGYLLREFAVATTEVAVGALPAASARYARIIPLLAAPVRGVNERLRRAVYFGCLHGKAQAEVAEAPASTLQIADELAEANAFFATHAETLRASYYWYRGESDKAETHRARAERLALRGGLSQTVVTLLTGRFASSAMLTSDPIALAQAIVELDHLTPVAPAFRVVKAYCQACLAIIGGRGEEAADRFASVIDSPAARSLPVWRLNYGFYAVALNAAGRSAQVRSLCERVLDGASADGGSGLSARLLMRQRAVAEARLGDKACARALLLAQLVSPEVRDNPLELGSVHRECAQVAIIAGISEDFEQHLADMSAAFRATRNPALIRQCEQLVAQAVRAGLRAPTPSMLPPRDELDGSTFVEEHPGPSRLG